MKKCLFILLGLTFLSACAPIPHVEKTHGRVVGYLHNHGQPAVGLSLQSCQQYQQRLCTQWQTTVTHANGYFEFPARYRFAWLMSFIIGDQIMPYEVRWLNHEMPVMLWHDVDIGPAAKDHHLTCELAQANSHGTYCEPNQL